MVILCDEIICNKIKQGLSYIPGDLVTTKHARLRILGMIISGSEFIISHKSQKPMKMWERRLLYGGTRLLEPWGPMSYKRNGLGWC